MSVKIIAATPAPSKRFASSSADAVELFRPTLDRHLSVPRIDPDGNSPGMCPCGFAHQRGIADRDGTENHARNAGCEPILDRLAIANAAAELKRNFDRRKNCANGRCIHRMSRERAIEIDEMQIFESRGLERARLCGGIVVEDRRLRHIALAQTHAASVFQIDRGKNDHDKSSRAPCQKPLKKRKSGRLTFLRMELRADDVVASDDRSRSRRHSPSSRAHARDWTDGCSRSARNRHRRHSYRSASDASR